MSWHQYLQEYLQVKALDLLVRSEDPGLGKASSDFQSLGVGVRAAVQANLSTYDGVEKQAIKDKALMEGKDHGHSSSLKTKPQGELGKFDPQ
jgi:hypothetical protein